MDPCITCGVEEDVNTNCATCCGDLCINCAEDCPVCSSPVCSGCYSEDGCDACKGEEE